jgi:peptidoglycan/xylan/chitin deacetylase (PgdA/CDA1 family)
VQPAQQLAPQAVQVVAQRGVRDELGADLLAALLELGVELQAHHEVVDEVVEALAHRVAGLGRQLADGARHGRHDLARGQLGGHLVQAHVAQRPDLARDGLGDVRLQLLALEQAGHLLQHVVEQRLVAPAGGERVERLAGEAREVDLRAGPRPPRGP